MLQVGVDQCFDAVRARLHHVRPAILRRRVEVHDLIGQPLARLGRVLWRVIHVHIAGILFLARSAPVRLRDANRQAQQRLMCGRAPVVLEPELDSEVVVREVLL